MIKGIEKQRKQKKQLFSELLSKTGSFMVQISSHFIADLKQLADLKRKMDEMDELGIRLKS